MSAAGRPACLAGNYITSGRRMQGSPARAAFPKGNVYMDMGNVLGTIYEVEYFSELFEVRGRPAITPWRLALVTLMQFSEGLSDRQAAEAVRARIDWKYALGLRLSDPGFDFSALSVGGTGSGELIMTLQRINQQYLPGSPDARGLKPYLIALPADRPAGLHHGHRLPGLAYFSSWRAR
jgi:hypothetical protein